MRLPVTVAAGIFLITGCHFTFDRTLGPGELRGTIVYEDGNGTRTPSPGARVVLENSAVDVTADARGRFVIGQLPAGTYAVSISASQAGNGKVDSGLRLRNITLSPGSNGLADSRDLGVIIIGALGGIQGSVTSGGTPVAGALAVLTGVAHTTAPAGSFTFQEILPGAYDLGAFAQLDPGMAAVSANMTVTVQPRAILMVGAIDLGQGTIVSSSNPTGSVSGQAQLAGVGSNQGIGVTLSSPQAAGITLPNVSTSDNAGDYEAPQIPPGVYSVTASLGGFESVSVSSVLIGAGSTSVPLITLSPLSISSTTTTRSGAGIPGACATAASCSTSAGFFTPASDCPGVPSMVLSGLEAAPACSAAAAALVALADCVATSSCGAFQDPEGPCADPANSFVAAAAMTSTCEQIAAPLLGVLDADAGMDAGTADAGEMDSGTADAGTAADGGTPPDAGTTTDAGTPVDAGSPADAGGPVDAGTPDAGSSPMDAGPPDSGSGPLDAGPVYTCDIAGNLTCPSQMICDLAGICEAPQHTVNGDGTVTDNVTGLVWQQTALSTNYYDWDPTGVDTSSAQYYCANLSLGAYASGWRLPTVNELFSLVENGAGYPLIDRTAFPGAPNSQFWTSTPMPGNQGYVWMIAFGPSAVVVADIYAASGGLGNARCVNDEVLSDGGTVMPPDAGPITTCDPTSSTTCSDGTVCALNGVCEAPQYIVDSEGGTVLDGVTGLVWQQSSNGNTYDWDPSGSDESSAQYYCANLSQGAYSSGWRLPTLAEAFSLIERQSTAPMIEHVAFPNMQTVAFLTSTPYGPEPSWPWTVAFDVGASDYTTQRWNYALCVWAGDELDGGPAIDGGGIPAPPTGVYAAEGDTQLSINWDDVPGATSYNLYYSTTQGAGTSGTRVSGVDTAYTLTGLTDEVTYYFVVTAVNASGESAPSAEVSGTPQPAVPPAPTGVVLTPGYDQIVITWNPTPSAVSYNVYFNNQSPFTGTNAYSRNGVSSPYTLSSLGSSTLYYVAVTAVNNMDVEGPPSTEVSATTLAQAPTNVFATGEDQQIAIQWAASMGATSYNLYYSTTSGMELGGTEVTGITSPYTLTGLTNGTPYYLVVTAVNAGGEDPSAEVSAKPSLVWGVQAVAGNGQVALTWSPVGGATSYNVYRGNATGFQALPVNLLTSTSVPSYTDGQVANYAEYFYLVTAIVSGLESPPSEQVSGTPVAWVTISTSGYDTFGITSDGRLWVWGSDIDHVGALGLGSMEPGPIYWPTPVNGNTNWTAVAASTSATFAIAGGAMYGWGSDENVGCLGMGVTLSTPIYVPTQIGSATNWTAVGTFSTSTCQTIGITSPGNLWDWGDLVGNDQLGNIVDAPTQVGGSNFDFVTFGYLGEAALGLTTAGTLWSWGDDYGSGVLGLGNVGFSTDYPDPQRVGSLQTWTAVASGYQNSVGIAAGALYTWGWDGNNGVLALGTPGNTHVYTPQQVGAATNWTAAAAASGACFAIGGGALYSWGVDGGLGLLGQGSVSQPVATPTQVGVATNWVTVHSAPTAATAFAIDNNSNLWAWGSNASGALGFGPAVSSVNQPTQVSVP